ncbi:MAG: hypothetical protein PF904_19660 [Kiritimatiellae bacterium]|jgi:hypothetical protein|nr:hypothetical protein [Kiritimatiellia bacterium]
MNPKLVKWEEPLFELLREVDCKLEEEFGDILPKHPSRPAHGVTSNPQNDGLFRVSANFTAGFGSDHGKGYSLEMDFVTLKPVSAEQTATIEARAVALIQSRLDQAMPERKLKVKREANCWKIVGDLSLD